MLLFVVSVSPVLPVRVCVDRRFPVRTSLTLMRDAKGRSSRDSTVTLMVHLLRCLALRDSVGTGTTFRSCEAVHAYALGRRGEDTNDDDNDLDSRLISLLTPRAAILGSCTLSITRTS